VDQGQFQLLEESFSSGGAAAVFDLLVRQAREQKSHQMLFGARIMQVRHRLGLPLIETETVLKLEGDQRAGYEAAFREAAREAGELCLAAGDIPSAWVYFKAIGEPAPISAAIESFTGGDRLDRVIEIAFQEGVNPRKGFQLILEHHGLCRAITWFNNNRDYASRQFCLGLLVRTLYKDLLAPLTEAVAAREGAPPDAATIGELICGRPWLFEDGAYYIDSTHVASVLRFSPELEDREALLMALDLAEYGCRLAPMFHFRGEPPFEDIYRDHAVYLKALLGQDVEAGIAHFRAKTSGDYGPLAAEVLIDLLMRLDRYPGAIQAANEFFPDPSSGPRSCPTAVQLCQMAGDYATLRSVARRREDLLGFAAGLIQA
jgi:hypothetical protein